QTWCYRHTVFQHQGFVVRRAEATNTYVDHYGAFLFALDGHAGHSSQRFLGGAGLLQFQLLGGDYSDGTRLACSFIFGVTDHLDTGQTAGLLGQNRMGTYKAEYGQGESKGLGKQTMTT